MANTRRPSKAKLAQEARAAATGVVADNLVNKTASNLPKLAQMAGMSAEKVEMLGAFLQSEVGKALITSFLAGAASYLPLPERFEKIGEGVASKLREKTMEKGGAMLTDVAEHFLGDIVKDMKQAEKTILGIDAKAKEIFEPFAETVTVGAKTGGKKASR